ncbi:hypothetical protein B0J17DRAFT_686541 [Rhizoctonia solani]|nr:hypothetical protein B0J17DRAFT_686541 [Rhizoctonia solani]
MAPTEMFAQMDLDHIDYNSTYILPEDSEYPPVITTTHNTPNKRHIDLSDTEDPEEEEGPLLSEYLCPICYSPPQSAVVTLCGHILCGSCLYGATTTRQVTARPLCPICRTPLPNLRFKFPSIQLGLSPNVPLNVMNQHQTPNTNVNVGGSEDRWDPARSGVIGLEILTVNEM